MTDEVQAEPLVDYYEVVVKELVELVATPSPAPAGGSVAAVAATLAAALAVMTARISAPQWPGGAAAAAQGEKLRARLAPLAREDAVAYLRALERMRPSDSAAGDDDQAAEARDATLAAALTEAAAVPLRIAEASADVAELAADIARFGNAAVAADAVAAATIASACARASAHIVDVNLRVTPDDELAQRARRAAEAAGAASDRAYAAGR